MLSNPQTTGAWQVSNAVITVEFGAWILDQERWKWKEEALKLQQELLAY